MIKVFSIFLRVLFALAVIAGIMYYPIENQLFSTDFYVDLFDSENLYQQMTVFGLGKLMEEMGDFSVMFSGLGSGISGMFDPNTIRDSVESLISEDWVKEQTISTTGQIIDYLNFKTPELSMVVDLTGIKKNINGDFGMALLEKSFKNLPECNLSNLMQFGMQMFSGGSMQSIPCRPSDSLMSMVSGLMDGMLGKSMDMIPDTIDLAQWMETEDLPLNQGAWSQIYKAGRWVIRNSLLIIPAVLVILVLFHWKQKERLPFIVGIPTLAAGLIAAAVALYTILFSGSMANNLLLDMVPETEFQGLLFLAEVISKGFKEIGISSLIFSGLAIGFGVCLLLLQKWLDSKRVQPEL